ncbi:MAG TPA: winged helix-turn-helix domain-containing protein [Vicinamibacterales bacterium]|nr:winged helix-turn-helix domain-containing protein [Vicinamibacterales bacterium]
MIHRFGVFEFDSDTGELRKNGRAVALEPQPAKALTLLLSKPDEIVTRDELRDAVWGADTHVDFDRGIAYCLSQIRAALGDSGDNPRFVQTVPRKGFRFIAPVAPASARETPGELRRGRPDEKFNKWVTIPLTLALAVAAVGVVFETLRTPPLSERAVIAVSVFDNETGVAAYDRAVANLSDAVLERLSKVDPERISLIGNSFALRQPRNIRNLKAIAQSVKADYVLLGQLQRGEDGLRFITHFIRLRDEAHLKANRLAIASEDLTGLEAAVVEEFERAVREHVLTRPSN